MKHKLTREKHTYQDDVTRVLRDVATTRGIISEEFCVLEDVLM